jgi:hypothetical protein
MKNKLEISDETKYYMKSNTMRSTSAKPIIRSEEDEEPIRLSKFSGGYIPDPQTPCKIDTLDWPAPPYAAAVPELRARSRSSSNRQAHSTTISINAGLEENDSDSEDNELEELDNEVKTTLQNQTDINDAAYQQFLITHRVMSTGVTSVSSSLARVKATRPNSKLRYQNNLFENDYNDYLLQYKSRKEFIKLLSKNSGSNKRHHSGGEESEDNDVNNNIDNDEDDEICLPAVKHLESKIKKDIEEISKIEKESSMAAAMLQELKTQEKILSSKLKLDPWKASRAPSANIELPIKTRCIY